MELKASNTVIEAIHNSVANERRDILDRVGVVGQSPTKERNYKHKKYVQYKITSPRHTIRHTFQGPTGPSEQRVSDGGLRLLASHAPRQYCNDLDVEHFI
jgi:hypothetical protein